MEVIFILIGASFSVALGFLLVFLISVRKGQYEDQDTPAMRMLFEDETKQKE